jgi:DNA-binding transcriptional LysR family regulator
VEELSEAEAAAELTLGGRSTKSLPQSRHVAGGSGEIGGGEPMQSLLLSWRIRHPGVALTLHEPNNNELFAGLAERTLDAALVTTHTLRPSASRIPIYREPLVAAVPAKHVLAARDILTWELLRAEPLLTQEWMVTT